jgi:hypothetical protein
MGEIVSISEHFQHSLTDLKVGFWDGLEANTKLAFKHFLEADSERMRDRFAVFDSHRRGLPGGTPRPSAGLAGSRPLAP